MAGNWRDCVGLAMGRPIKDEEARALEQRFASARDRARYAGEAFDDATIALKIAQEIAVEKALAKRNVLLNQIAYRSALEYTSRFGDKALALRALLGGINEVVEGGRLSIDAQHNAIFREYLGGMLADLRKAGAESGQDLLGYMNAGGFRRDPAVELAIRKELRGESSGDAAAKKIAEVMNKWLDAARLRENRAGSWIGHLDDYGGAQTHDARKVFRAAGETPKTPEAREAAFQAWREFVLPLIDTDRMLPEVLSRNLTPEQFLRNTWNAIAADRWDTAAGGEFTGLHHYIGPGNLGKRESASRVIHFKDATAAQAYNDRFGNGSLVEGIIHRLEKSARATALMETLGPNPEAMLDRLRRDLAKELQGAGDAKGAKALGGKAIDNLYAEVSGATRSADNKDLAAWGSGLRALESMTKLGAATLSSIGDLATVAGELRYQGRGFLESWRDAFAGLIRGRGDAETRQIAELVGVGFEGVVGGVMSRFHSTDGALGGTARLLNLFFRFNGLNWWTDAHKTTAGLVTARYFAQHAGSAWASLPAETTRLLTQYGIDRDGWNIIRKGAVKEANGTEFLTPDAIRALPDLAFGIPTGGRTVAQMRDRLVTAYQALIVDRADFAVPTPGARERAWMNQGTERGTVLGEALRFVMQFKAFPLAMISKTMGREVYGRAGEGKFGALGRMGELVAQLTVMGYLAQSAKDLARGKEPADPTNINTVYRAMTQGGGLGIYGDFVLGEHDRFGRSPAETALGPAFGTAGDLVKLVNKAARGDLDAGGAIRFAVQNTPFLNLFYARPALDYFVLHPIYESLKPGYIGRMNREAEKRYGQDYWWY